MKGKVVSIQRKTKTKPLTKNVQVAAKENPAPT
jgi:hypothetical protein